MQETVDLTNCDREPIHISGAIQPHGLLLAFEESSGIVRMASDNAATALGRAAPLGQTLLALLGEVNVTALREPLSRRDPREGLPVRLTLAGKEWDAIVHRSTGLVVLELEPATTDVTFSSFYSHVRSAVAKLQSASRLEDLFQITADQVRALTGFDRVMVYRFDREWNGEVVAEARREDIEPFLGLHYPASDIPVQARRLYTLNWLRIIVDIAYVPVAISPARAPSGEPLDLSFSTLRSVSPIHVEYLRNMGVGASMSVSIVKDGQLYGLIACHHYSAKFVPYEARTACEFLGQTLSFQADARERAQRSERISAAKEREATLIGRLARQRGFFEQLVHPDVLALVEADGFAVRYQGEIHVVGRTPDPERIEQICNWLTDHQTEAVWSTDRLAQIAPELEGVTSSASGLISVALSREQQAYLLWFRPEVAQTVNWAGDPRKSVQMKDGAPRLSPRGSFALWVENTQGRAVPWADWQLEVAGHFREILLDRIIRHATELAILNRQLEAASRAKDEFLATLGHELRTPLSAITGFASLLKRGVAPDRVNRAAETIERAARTQARLIDDLLDVSRIVGGKLRLDVQSVDIVAVVDAAVDTVRHAAEAKSVRLDVIVDPQVGAVTGDPARLQQVVWNLLINAVKFTPKGGRVQLTLRSFASAVEITVSDTGEGIADDMLQSVFERFKQVEEGATRRHGGLGLGLAIVKHLVELHGGTVVARSEGVGKGATFIVRLPIAIAKLPVQADDLEMSRARETVAPSLAGIRILVVDDEADGRAFLRPLLEQQDAIVHTAGFGVEALSIVESTPLDVVVSDIGMPKMDGYELMRKIRELPADRGGAVRAVALTAYARAEDRLRALKAGFQSHVAKPVDVDELLAVIASLVDRITPS